MQITINSVVGTTEVVPLSFATDSKVAYMVRTYLEVATWFPVFVYQIITNDGFFPFIKAQILKQCLGRVSVWSRNSHQISIVNILCSVLPP